MRLTTAQISTIKRLAKQTFGQPAEVYLFGSRVDDQVRGGDIDIYIDTDARQSLLRKKLRLTSLLQMELGEQRFDIVVRQNPERAIEFKARTRGVHL